ncbi:MAG: hypothetical protein MJZ69_00155 [Bacteroidaceae bacterium]|nr:hypothetical protein [Candidatus Minthousia equi]MCQ2245184.1 hypothetical protein [Bacteroidaceae bacterium]MDO4955546.1 hypothetical protein [Bacteroidales bacterium]
MKILINSILVVCAIVLAWICYASIMGPIKFDDEKARREKVIISRLIDIRKAQEEYRLQHQGKYTDSFDSLIDFVKNAKRAYLIKEGVLSDEQLDKGLTEAKAAAIVRSGDAAAIAANGLTGFRRDTIWKSISDTIFGVGFNADSLRYIPFSNGQQFKMAARSDTTDKGQPLNLFEARCAYKTYLSDLDHQELVNLEKLQGQLYKYCGLKVGDIEAPNNNAGNWE